MPATCVNIEVWGASSREDHGCFVFRNYVGNIPFIEHADFLPAFNEVLRTKQIDWCFQRMILSLNSLPSGGRSWLAAQLLRR